VKKHRLRKIEAFSLVEVTIAIGIFAFVIVGIIGLFPTALRMQSESSVETRAAMIAQQLLDAVDLSIEKWTNPSGNVFTNIVLRDGPGLVTTNSRRVNLLDNSKFVVAGYQVKSSMPYYLYTNNAIAAWRNGIASGAGAQETGGDKAYPPASSNDIVTLARIWATNVPGKARLYQINVEVRSPAFAPLTNTAPSLFSTYRLQP
jgi:Tfp pilus assembly protein PilV